MRYEKVESIRKKSINVLVRKTNEIYTELKNKSSMVKSITFSNRMDVELNGFDNEQVNVKTISEGEKGILMYSIIHGLHAMSGSNMPMIIDSPLGKMDTIHTNNLINNYYPIASEQVIILSHDREITRPILMNMIGKISHSYLLRSEEQPKIIEGYFE